MAKNSNFLAAIALVFLTAQAYAAKDLISISAVGDIMMGTTYPADMLPENEGLGLFKPAQPWLNASDIRFGNFEGTFFDGPAQPDGKAGGPNRFLFRTPTRMSSRLKEAGFNVVSLSNNHAHDFGSAGISSTKKTLEVIGTQYSSKGGEVALFNVDGTELALIAVDFYKGPRSITQPESTYEEVRRLKQAGKLVIISAHAGAEGEAATVIKKGPEIFLGENRGDSIEFARTAIDNGADLIVMAGPHVPRGLELYKNRLIAYSLGNFMTGRGISLDGFAKLAPLLRVQITRNGEFHQGQIVSFVQKRDPQRIELDPQAIALKLMKDLSKTQFPDSPLVFQNDGLFSAK